MLKQGHLEWMIQDHVQTAFNITTDGDSTTSPVHLFLCLTSLIIPKKHFLGFNLDSLIFRVPITSCPVSLQTLLRKPSMLLPYFFPSGIYTRWQAPRAFLSPGSIIAVLSASLHTRDAPAFHHFCDPSLDSRQYNHVSFILGSPDQDPALQTWPHQCLEENKDLLPWPPGNIPPNPAQEAVGKFFKSTHRNSIYFNSLKARKKRSNTHLETIATGLQPKRYLQRNLLTGSTSEISW